MIIINILKLNTMKRMFLMAAMSVVVLAALQPVLRLVMMRVPLPFSLVLV